MTDDVTCLHCGGTVKQDTDSAGTFWYHVLTNRQKCRPTYAAPVFPDVQAPREAAAP